MNGGWRAWLRLFAVQGTWNYERMLGVGMGYAAEPLLEDLKTVDPVRHTEAVVRSAEFFNCHPNLAGLALGATARAEYDGVPGAQIARLRTALCSPLGALGDQLFWAGLVPLLVGAALVGIVLGARWWAVGGFLLLHGGDDSSGTSPKRPITPAPSTVVSSSPSSSQSSSPSSPSPSVRVKEPPSNVAGFAQASAPRHAPAGVDFAGRPVSYVAANLVDGLNDTCWRTPGDATGTVLTFRLDQPTRISRVGLVNGYAKNVAGVAWYPNNRRILVATWQFADGSAIEQTFAERPGMQTMRIPPVATKTLSITFNVVTPPGSGDLGRDYTAISEVSIIGQRAG